MYLNILQRLCAAQAVTADAATSEVINQGAAGDPYEGMWHFVKVDEDFATCDSVTFKLQTSVDEAFTEPIDVVTKTVLVASLKADKVVWCDRIPMGLKKYIRGYFQVDGADATKGKVTWHFGVRDVRVNESGELIKA